MERKKIKLKVIPEPDPNTMSILEPSGKILEEKSPISIGDGDTDYICGECDWLLLSGIEEDQVQSMVFKCPNCGAYNSI